MGATACTPGRSAMASASLTVRVWAPPLPERTPPVEVCPESSTNRLLPIAAMVCLIAYCAPCPMDIINTTALTPMTMPSMVSMVRSRFAPIARQASPSIAKIMRRLPVGARPGCDSPVAGTKMRVGLCPTWWAQPTLRLLRVQCSCCHPLMRELVADDAPVEESHLAFRVTRDISLVGDQHDGDAFAVQLFEQRHDFFAGLAVEVAGGFIRKNQTRAVDQGARNRHALLLASGNLVGHGVRLVFQADLAEHLMGAPLALLAFHAAVDQRQAHVFQQRHARQQIEALEHEADGAIAQQCQLVLAQFRNVAAIQQIAPGRRLVETPEEIHEGGFAGTGRPHDRDEFAGNDAETDIFQCRKQSGGSFVGLVQAFDADDGFSHQNILIGGLLPELLEFFDLSAACASPTTSWSPALSSPATISVLRLSVMPSDTLTGTSSPCSSTYTLAEKAS